MKAINTTDFDKYKIEIQEFCKLAVKDSDNKITRRNMTPFLYDKIPESLMNKLYIKKSFELMTLIYDGDKLIGLAGVEPYTENVALIARRLFILKDYRKQKICHKYIIVPQVKYITEKGYILGLGTVNEYKKIIYQIMKRKIKQGSKYIYSNFELLDNPIMINNVPQYVFGIFTDKKYGDIKKWLIM